MAFFVGMLLINAVLLIPPLRGLFDVADLTGLQFAWIYVLSITSMLLVQIVKFVKGMMQRSAS